MNLLIVESPNKVKTIAKYLGEGWSVAASVGHIRDLPLRAIGIRPSTFELEYELSERGEDVVRKLRGAVRQAKHVYLATDPDREGEAIAWHVQDVLQLRDEQCSRVTFNVIDEPSIRKALAQPRKVDRPLVYAQEARRALDRLVGYKVSPALSEMFGSTMSAGRVQSPAVRLVVERERAIAQFKATQHFGAVVQFDGWRAQWDTKSHADENGYVLDPAKAAEAAACRQFTVTESTQREVREAPPAPFSTSTLLQAASVALKMNPDQAMKTAQRLFEQGLISYHRTDAQNLDPEQAEAIRQYLAANSQPVPPQPRRFAEKGDSQLGHEAIRPASIATRTAGTSKEEQALYALIWKRAIASQMQDAVYKETALRLQAAEPAFQFVAKGRVELAAGWRALTAEDATSEEASPDEADAENAGLVPALPRDATATAAKGEVVKKTTKPPGRYTQASLVKRLEALGIGRPSTYAAILKNIVDRGYIAEEQRKLKATQTGIGLVDALLASKFGFLDYAYTRQLEERLDAIAQGQLSYRSLVEDVHGTIETDVATAKATSTVAPLHPCPVCAKALRRRKTQQGPVIWLCSGYPDDCKQVMDDKNGEPVERKSHPCPKCKRPMYRRSGKMGFFWACSGYSQGCDHTLPDVKGKPGARAEVSDHRCPKCSKGLVHRVKKARGKTKGYDFWGCSGFPECEFTAKTGQDGRPELSAS